MNGAVKHQVSAHSRGARVGGPSNVGVVKPQPPTMSSQQAYAQQIQNPQYARGQPQVQYPRPPQPGVDSYPRLPQPGVDGFPPQQPRVTPVTPQNIHAIIGLLSVRMSRVEQQLEEMRETAGQVPEGMCIVDDSVIRAIQVRLETLEKNKSSTTATAANQLLPPQLGQTAVAALSTADASKIKKLTDTVVRLKTDVTDTKDMLTKLQAFTMETNQKLVDALFPQQQEQPPQMQYDTSAYDMPQPSAGSTELGSLPVVDEGDEEDGLD